MRLFQTLSGLSVLAGTVLAHEGQHHDHDHHRHHDAPSHDSLAHAEICGGSGGSIIPGSDGLCGHGIAGAGEAQKVIVSDAESQKPPPQDDGPRYPLWTHTKPCFNSTKSELEICVFADEKFANGRGASFVMTERRAAHVAKAPAFKDPELVKHTNQDIHRTAPAKYDMKEIPGKGMGLIAKQHIRRGDLIMANTVSLMIDYRAFEELPKEHYTQLQAAAVDYLPEAHREAILALSTHDDTDRTYIQRVDKIAATNAFDIEPDEDDEVQDYGFYVVFPEIARMNHDCRPNADYYYDHETLTQYIHAVRDVFPGEELTLSYINPIMKRKARVRKLQRIWGFECACPLCTQEQPRVEASDLRIRQIKELSNELDDWEPQSRANPAMAELMISLYEQEKLWGSLHEAYVSAALEYNAAGEPWTAIKYARLAVERGMQVVGPKDADVLEMAKMAEDPWAHWSWMKRIKVRGGWGKRSKETEDDE
ncbi:hypothetical protein QBC42DRAFT_276040 [Cladorrhinum samala]|uniref:SET domain-containing protein n=1 Tax=Cladorrhinum samala TaxID=585594 RepID=A0AAV9HFU6_9PEZI|nr:hypothetical protein QBC42DRAFT_276040 [Cladorrhinum samala]